MNILGYIRVSTDDQVKGQGPDVQQAGIEAWCEREGHVLVGITRDEGISGTKDDLDRPGLAEALAALEDGAAEGLVVWKVDRLARDLILQEVVITRLAKAGRIVFSTLEDISGDTPTKILLRQILGAIAQYELAIITGRMSAGRAMKHSKGGYAYGAPPFGFAAHERELISSPEEQETLALIVELRGRSLREICAELERQGRQPKHGGRWHPSVVRRILQRIPAQEAT